MPALTKAERATRARGIGGSEAAIAIGVHPKITPLQLYRKKVYGEPLPINVPDFNLKLGHQLEPVVAWCFTERTGLALAERREPVVHPRYDFIRGYVDRVVIDRAEGFEAKAWSEFSRPLWGEPGGDDVPLAVLVQCVHYILASGYEGWHVGALLGGEFLEYFIDRRREDVLEMVLDRERRFWRHVEDREPPPAMNVHDLRLIYSAADPDKFIVASDDDFALWLEYRECLDQRRALESRMSKIEFKLKERMGDAAAIVHPDDERRKIVTWKNQDRKDVDVAALKRDGLYDVYLDESRTRVFRTRD